MLDYQGKLTDVRKTVDKNRLRLIGAYRRVFDQRIGRLIEYERRFRPFDEEKSMSYGNPGERELGLTQDGNSCFKVHYRFQKPVEVDQTGRIAENHAIASPLITISEKSIEETRKSEKYTGLPEELVSVVHEYNHFALFCFQNTPDNLAGLIAWQNAIKFGDIDVSSPVKNLKPEQIPWFKLYSYHHCVSELGSDFLTAKIFENLGYNPNSILSQQGTRTFLDQYGIIDPRSLFDFSNNWNRRIRSENNFEETFLRSLENVVVEKRG